MNRFFCCKDSRSLNFIGHDGRGENRISPRRVDERNESELVVIVHTFRCGRGGNRTSCRNSADYGSRASTNASCNDGFRSAAEQLAATHFLSHRILLIQLAVISAAPNLRRCPEPPSPRHDYLNIP